MGTKQAQHREIPNSNMIECFFHCIKCINEIPANTSPRDWASLEVGWTDLGLQVWCKRHEMNVIHIDFDGHQFYTNRR